MKPLHYPRLYNTIVREHLSKYRQMVFLSGPRQVGKTTLGEQVSTDYLSWDDSDARWLVQSGQRAVVDFEFSEPVVVSAKTFLSQLI